MEGGGRPAIDSSMDQTAARIDDLEHEIEPELLERLLAGLRSEQTRRRTDRSRFFCALWKK